MPPNCDHIGRTDRGRHRQPARTVCGRAALAGGARDVPRAAGAARRARGTRAPSVTCWWWPARAARPGAAAMSGMAALRAGAGLVTVASAASAIAEIASHAPELMTEPLRETESGSIALNADLEALAKGKTVIAMGPGLGRAPANRRHGARARRGVRRPHGAGRRCAGGTGSGRTAAHAHPDAASRRNGAPHRARPPPRFRRTASAPRASSPRSTASPWCSKGSAP